MSVIDLNLEENRLTQVIMDCLFKVHSAMGPGLLEGVYEECLIHEINKRGLSCIRQVPVPLIYDEIVLQSSLRLDIVVDDRVIIELKSVESLLPVHEAQIISYLKLSNIKIGFLVNFNVPLIKNGVRRFVNTHSSSASPRLRGEIET